MNEFKILYADEKLRRCMAVADEFSRLILHAIRHMIIIIKTMPTLNKIMELLKKSTVLSDYNSEPVWNYSRTALCRIVVRP